MACSAKGEHSSRTSFGVSVFVGAGGVDVGIGVGVDGSGVIVGEGITVEVGVALIGTTVSPVDPAAVQESKESIMLMRIR